MLTGALVVTALVLAAFAAREIFSPAPGRFPAWRLSYFKGWTGEDGCPTTRFTYACLGLAALMGLALQFVGHTGDLTLLLVALGILGGYFSFAPPLAWRRRGLGEAAGGLCFGLLPVVTGFYLQSGYWVAEELFYALPLTFTGFNLFLVYGFPNPQAEAPPPLSLAARWRPVSIALLYTVVNVLAILVLAAILFYPPSPLPLRALIWPLLLLAVVNQELLKRRAYREEGRLRLLCLLSLALHLGMAAVFCLMVWQRL
jgi:1,4-dihydroxy-2-naphthoate octaprenyltransferase